MSMVARVGGGQLAVPATRDGPRSLLRSPDEPSLGVGRIASGADGGPPPLMHGAASNAMRTLAQRGGATPSTSHPSAGSAASPPTLRGKHIDVRA